MWKFLNYFTLIIAFVYLNPLVHNFRTKNVENGNIEQNNNPAQREKILSDFPEKDDDDEIRVTLHNLREKDTEDESDEIFSTTLFEPIYKINPAFYNNQGKNINNHDDQYHTESSAENKNSENEEEETKVVVLNVTRFEAMNENKINSQTQDFEYDENNYIKPTTTIFLNTNIYSSEEGKEVNISNGNKHNINHLVYNNGKYDYKKITSETEDPTSSSKHKPKSLRRYKSKKDFYMRITTARQSQFDSDFKEEKELSSLDFRPSRTTIYGSEYEINETNNVDNSELTKFCQHINQSNEFNIKAMVDVWQVVYYHLSEDILCFKIFIRETTDEERMHYSYKYGSFRGKINWDNCILEIKSSNKEYSKLKKHFLQITNEDLGIMENVILLQETTEGNDTLVSFIEDSPNQWLVLGDLLLMRDCDNGDVVIFTRVPRKPRDEDLQEALEIFGEKTIRRRKFPCKSNEENDK